MDRISEDVRSRIMRAIPSKDTKPELLVRKLLHRMGYRYRVHAKWLAGKPDIVFTRKEKAIFVHGCFWHQHKAKDCPYGRVPESRREYWEPKLRRNVLRDAQNQITLENSGWTVLIIWECQLRDLLKLEKSLTIFLGPPLTI